MRKLLFAMLAFISLAGHSQDLVITEVTGPKAFDQYAPFTATVTIKNAGIIDIGYNQTNLYLSTDNVYDESDEIVTGLELFELAAGAAETLTAFATQSNQFILPGNYFLLVVADPDEYVTETNEANNVLAVAGYTIRTPSVDFVLSALSLDKTTVAANDIVHPTYEIQNTGTTNIGGTVFTVFYLSNNNTWSADDINLGYVQSPPLTGPDIYNNGGIDDVSIPSVANGNYFIIARTDDYLGGSYYTETNETNNTRVSSQIQVISANVDLQITSDITANIQNGSFLPYNIDLSFTVQNNGTTGASGYTANVYLSETGAPMGEAVFLFSGYASHIPGGASKTLTLNGTVSAPPGEYYVVVELNPDHGMAETNYANNIRASTNTYTVTDPIPPSVTITAAGFNETYDNTDSFITLDITLLNSSSGFNNGYQDYDVAISDDLGNEVAVIPYTEFFSLAAGESIEAHWGLMLNTPLAPGAYTVQIRCTNTFDCFTNTFPASLTIEEVEYTLGVLVAGEDGTPMTSGSLFLYEQDGIDGVKFVQKIAPANGGTFILHTNNNPHTLYYVPDHTIHPDFAPTVFEKKVLFTTECFFSLTRSATVGLDVLKVTKPASGIGRITGSVADQAGPGIFSVILLNASGGVAGITQTDANGKFVFGDLQPAIYSIVVAREPDVVNQKILVNISQRNANADIEITAGGIVANVQVVKYTQTITFPELAHRTFGDAPFSPGATASSGLVITYTSTNTAVATILNGNINIVSAGTTVIRARQNGNANYAAATQVERTLVVDKAPQTITFDAIPEKESDDLPFNVTATSSSLLPVSFTSGNTAIATVDGSTITIHGVGMTTITATQPGNENYLAATPVSKDLVVTLFVGIGENPSDITLYPNPTRGKLLIKSLTPVKNVTTTDITGKTTTLSLHDNIADLTPLSPGMYVLYVDDGRNVVRVKVVKINE